MSIPVSKGGKGSSGPAEVTVTSNKIRVVFIGTKDKPDGQVIDVLREDAPDYMVSGRQLVTLSSDNTKIFNARPIGGSHLAEFIGFASKDAEPPTPRKVDAKAGTSRAGKPYKIPEHLEFTALFRITRGTWKGYQIANNLFYAFLPYEGGITQIKGAGSDKLTQFLEVTGIDFVTDDIPFSENVLVYLEKLLLSRNKQLIISLTQEGWVDSVVEAPSFDEPVEPKQEVKKEEQQSTEQVVAGMVKAGMPGAKEMFAAMAAAKEKTVEELLAELGYDQ